MAGIGYKPLDIFVPYYDRNPTTIVYEYHDSLSAHAWTVRFTYTVPSGKRFAHLMCHEECMQDIVNAGTWAAAAHEIMTGTGEDIENYELIYHADSDGFSTVKSSSIPFFLDATGRIRGLTKNTDDNGGGDTAHFLKCLMVGVEFDA